MANVTEISWESPYSLVFVVIIVVLMIIISAVTVFGNLLVILSFYLDKNIRSPSNYFILSLAISDLLIGLEGFPFYSIYTLRGDKWPLGWFVCDLWLSVDYSICLASIYTVLLITIDRFCSVRLPARYRNWRSKDKVNLMIILTWLMPVLLFFVSIFGWSSFVGERTIAEHECYVQFMNNPYFNMSMYIAYYWSTLVVMVILYAGIYRAAWSLQRKSEQKQQQRMAVLSTMKSNKQVATNLSPVSAPVPDRSLSCPHITRSESLLNRQRNSHGNAKETMGENGSAICLTTTAKSAATTNVPRTENLTMEATSQLQPSGDFTSSDFTTPLSSSDSNGSHVMRKKNQEAKRNSNILLKSGAVEVKAGGALGTQFRRMSQAVSIDNVRILLKKLPTQGRISISFNANPTNSVCPSVATDCGAMNNRPKAHSEYHLESYSPVWKPRLTEPELAQYDGLALPDEDYSTYVEPVALFELPSEQKSSRSCIESSTAPYVTPETSEIASSTPSIQKDLRHISADVPELTKTDELSCFGDSMDVLRKIRYIDDSLNSSLRSNCRETFVSPVRIIPTIHEEKSLSRSLHTLSEHTESRLSITCQVPVTVSQEVLGQEPQCLNECNTEEANNEVFLTNSITNTSPKPVFLNLDANESRQAIGRRSTRKRRSKTHHDDSWKQKQKEALLARASTTTLPATSNIAFPSEEKGDMDDSHTSPKSKRRTSHMLALLREKSRKGKFRSENRARKALRTITFILGAFIIFWTPFYVCATIIGFCQRCVPPWLFTSSYYLCYLNSAINPFCYAFANVQFKKTFLRILKGNFHRVN